MLDQDRHEPHPGGVGGKHPDRHASPLPERAESVGAGNIDPDGSIRILDSVEGDIRANRIVVATGARVDGALLARTIHVDGTVNGPIIANRVSLGPTARVKGNLTYDVLTVATGASLSGVCRDRTLAEPTRAETGSGSELALPFSRARTACGRSGTRPLPNDNPAEHKQIPAVRARSMRAVWDAYERNGSAG